MRPVRLKSFRMERLNSKDMGEAALTVELDRFDPGSFSVIRRHRKSLLMVRSAVCSPLQAVARAIAGVRNMGRSRAVDQERQTVTVQGVLQT